MYELGLIKGVLEGGEGDVCRGTGLDSGNIGTPTGYAPGPQPPRATCTPRGPDFGLGDTYRYSIASINVKLEKQW